MPRPVYYVAYRCKVDTNTLNGLSRFTGMGLSVSQEGNAINPLVPFIASCCAAAVLERPLHAAQTDPAANYPNKPIRLIVPYSAGGATDITARVIGAKFADQWGQQVVVDNRTGAGGAIAVEFTANATPDGHTLCLFSASRPAPGRRPEVLVDHADETSSRSRIDLGLYVVYHPPRCRCIREGADRATPKRIRESSTTARPASARCSTSRASY